MTVDANAERAAVSGSLDITLGRLAAALDRRDTDRALEERDLSRAVQPINLPAVQFAVTGGSVVQPVAAQPLLGPEDGYAWVIKRITVAGLTAAAYTGGSAASVSAYGTQTNPAANTGIAVLTSANLGLGLYSVSVTTQLAGTVTSTDQNNMKLIWNSGPSTQQLMTAAAAGVPYANPPIVINRVNAGTNIAVQAIANASGASAIYQAQITATPLQNPADQVTLYREIVGGGGQPQNALRTFTSQLADWEPGDGLTLRSPETITIAGSGLLASTVTVSAEGDQVALPWLARYKL